MSSEVKPDSKLPGGIPLEPGIPGKYLLAKGIIESVTTVAIMALDENGIINQFNTGAERMLGYTADEVVGKHTPFIFHLPSEMDEMSERLSRELGYKIEGFEMFEEAIKRYGPQENQWTCVRKDGSHLNVHLYANHIFDENGSIIGRIGIINDITAQKNALEERKKLEHQLHQAQKMEAIGTMAGGIAHDFNNILSIIFGYADLAGDDITPDNRAHQCLDQIVKAASRAKALVQQIMTFTRQVEHQKINLNLTPLVKETLQMLRSTFPSTISINLKISQDTGNVMADPSQIHQVLMNLCVNASHAMKEDVGQLTVTLESTGPENLPQTETPLKPGEYVKLAIEDTGYGISPEILVRIFDPYFTTKKQEEGTGLGLSVVLGIIKEHNGEITVQSEPGQGTCFSIYFPVVKTAKEEQPDKKMEEPVRGNGHILLVDDEPGLVESIRYQLEKMGYKVTAETGSLEALEFFKAHHHDVDLVLTDMTMPNMTGLQLTENILAIKPGLPVVLLTGFSDSFNETDSLPEGISDVVLKPFDKNNMARIIRKVLAESRQ
ncbi:MAG: response regulator [bacterium]|nr:response regulator [bacterium]